MTGYNEPDYHFDEMEEEINEALELASLIGLLED
jgi:hypothetical protein